MTQGKERVGNLEFGPYLTRGARWSPPVREMPLACGWIPELLALRLCAEPSPSLSREITGEGSESSLTVREDETADSAFKTVIQPRAPEDTSSVILVSL